MRSFNSEAALLQHARMSTPATAKRPALVPYIQEQLVYLEMMDEPDYGGEFREPTVIHNMNVGQRTKIVYKSNYDLRQFEVWWPSPAPPPFITEDEGNNPEDPYPFITDDKGPEYPEHVASHHSRLDPLDIPVAIVANGANTPFLSDSISSQLSQSTKYPITEERERSKQGPPSLTRNAGPSVEW
jgi:hypothetical protein